MLFREGLRKRVGLPSSFLKLLSILFLTGLVYIDLVTYIFIHSMPLVMICNLGVYRVVSLIALLVVASLEHVVSLCKGVNYTL